MINLEPECSPLDQDIVKKLSFPQAEKSHLKNKQNQQKQLILKKTLQREMNNR